MKTSKGVEGRVAAALAGGAGVPLTLAFVLNLMRPDLMQPMLDHVFGYALVGAEVLLVSCGTGLFLFAALAEFKTRAAPVIMVIAGAVFFTLPALFLSMFGPIVFAFMYGEVK